MIPASFDSRKRRVGFTLGEAVVVLSLIVLAALFVLMALPRSRESARLVGCQRNLAQIGIGLIQYSQIQERLPAISQLDGLENASASATSVGPLRGLLEMLQIPNFTELMDPKTIADRRPGAVPAEGPVRGFVCGSDPRATDGRFAAPISYRGSTGGDPLKPNGAFVPGQAMTLAAINAGDGAGFTAAFSERLVGTGTDQQGILENYRVAISPVPPDGCAPATDVADYRGDAGSSWYHADYRSTLYNHALPPNGPSSCIAADGQSAFMGASSGHVAGINLLLLDGSLRTIRPSIDLKVWRDFGTIGTPRPSP